MTEKSGARFGGTSFAKHVQGIEPGSPSSKDAFTRAASGDTPPAGGGQREEVTSEGGSPRPPSANRLEAAQKRSAGRQRTQSFDLSP